MFYTRCNPPVACLFLHTTANSEHTITKGTHEIYYSDAWKLIIIFFLFSIAHRTVLFHYWAHKLLFSFELRGKDLGLSCRTGIVFQDKLQLLQCLFFYSRTGLTTDISVPVKKKWRNKVGTGFGSWYWRKIRIYIYLL